MDFSLLSNGQSAREFERHLSEGTRLSLMTGARVRVHSGSLEGMEGTLVGWRGDRVLIVLATGSPAYLETAAESVRVVEKELAS